MNIMERRKAKAKQMQANEDSYSSLIENGEAVPLHTRSSLKGDERSIALLFFLYTLQGIPLGLSAAIPMILQNRGVSYKQQVSFVG